MENVHIMDSYAKAKYSAFKWRHELAVANKLVLAICMAGLTGILAQTKTYLPWTPVPITGQTFAVLMAGVLLGKNWGGISQAIYVILGTAGIPWFSGAKGGYAALMGPTGGYLIGFIFAAFFIGHFTDKYIKARSFKSLFFLMIFAEIAIIYGFGLLQLGIWIKFTKGALPNLWQLLLMGAIPFMPGCVIKAFIAATIAKGILPKKAFNNEIDA